MTKAEIVGVIADELGLDRATVLDVVESFMKNVKESVADEKNVYLRGFGSFIVKQRARKVARNISKETSLIIPAHNIPAFKPSKTFVRLVAGEVENAEA